MQNQETANPSRNIPEIGPDSLITIVEIGLRSAVQDLEKLSIYLRAYSSQNSHPINSKRIQEYQALMDAFKDYKDALIEQIRKVYEKK